jgi:leader peptidase (prepilin peptidase)/N-methyltransferase
MLGSTAWVVAVVAVFGLLIGSFLNVCIYRLPRRESIVFPASRCPACGAGIRPWDNVPVLAWFWLHGRCRDCAASISWRYPSIEAANGVAYGLIAWRFGFTADALIYAAFFSALLVITVIDFDFQIIPDRISLPGIPIAFASALSLGHITWWESLLGAALPAVLFMAIIILSRGGMGLGDVKLIAMIGALVGWKLALLTIFVGAVAGSVVGIALMVFQGKGRKTAVPFGPFLSLGAVVSVSCGTPLIQWYLGLGRW